MLKHFKVHSAERAVTISGHKVVCERVYAKLGLSEQSGLSFFKKVSSAARKSRSSFEMSRIRYKNTLKVYDSKVRFLSG